MANNPVQAPLERPGDEANEEQIRLARGQGETVRKPVRNTIAQKRQWPAPGVTAPFGQQADAVDAKALAT